jgi:transmembrane sensor
VLEQGRARFWVAKDALRPFTVRADGRVVVATGTQFSVERIGGQVRVILYEGKVAVLAERSGGRPPEPVRVGPGRAPAEQLLKPGGELVLTPNTTTVAAPTAQLTPADLGRSLAWEGGQLVFSDEPLARAVERVNRYAEHPVVLADSAAGGVLVNGVFTADDTTAFVEGVTEAYPLDARESQGATVISYDRSTDR